MKILFLLLIYIPAIAEAQGTSNGIKFTDGLSWAQIKMKAKTEGKFIFMDVFATWCGPCKRMDHEVYPNETVGNAINSKFISVRVQMDSSKTDNEQTRSWYADAKEISKVYKIEGYPSFLFFNPDGILLYTGIGYRDTGDFIALSVKALDPENLSNYTELEDYKNGKKKYADLKKLALFAKKIVKDDSLARQIANDYILHLDGDKMLTKENILFILNMCKNRRLADSLARCYKVSYLDKLTEEEVCTKDNVMFVISFRKLVTDNDNIFKVCYYQPAKVNKIMGGEIWGRSIVDAVIVREELERKLIRNEKPIYKNPPWRKILSDMSLKFGLIDVKRLLLEYQLSYYRNYDLNWKVGARLKKKEIKKYPPKAGGLEVYEELNMYAWDIFLYCDNVHVLNDAIKWTDMAITLDKKYKWAYFDTKANLLYKLGKREGAVSLEEQSALLAPAEQEIQENFRKMKNGEPTWIN
jgi:thioredoxin-related protein